MSPLNLTEIIRTVLEPNQFVVSSPMDLMWEYAVDEVLYWEIFQGRLLGQSMTRNQRRFRSWNVRQVISGRATEESAVSIKQDVDDAKIYVTRGLLVYGHQTVAVGNVIESQEAQVWQRELVGAVDPAELAADQIRDERFDLKAAAGVPLQQRRPRYA